MKIHYYLVCSRFEALIASQLPPDDFGLYMAVGTKKLASGHVIFFEVDGPRLDRSHFRLDEVERRCVPHADGSPRRSKYVSAYRAMEFIGLPAYGALYLTTADGRVLRLDAAPYDEALEEPGVSLYYELCPLIPVVVSGLAPRAFCASLTNPENPIHAPRLFFADLRLDLDERGRLAPYLPYSDPAHIAACIRELGGSKDTKTVSRTPSSRGFFRVIRRGFFIGDQTGIKHYPFPSLDELEIEHQQWWHSASAK